MPSNVDKIINLCQMIKNNIDWEYETYSGYQEMMGTIEALVDEIIQEVKENK